MGKERIPGYKKFSVIVSIAIIISSFFLPWLKLQGQSYTTIELCISSYKSGGMLSFIADATGYSVSAFISGGEGVSLLVMSASIYMALTATIIYLGYIILIMCRKNGIVLEICAGCVELVMTYLYVSAVLYVFIEGMSGTISAYIVMFLMALEFMGSRLIREYEEATANARESRRLDKLAREERKRRLYFPGRYSRLFYLVVWKNFKDGWRHYVLFIASSALAASFLFSAVVIMNMMTGVHSEEFFVFDDGFSKILTTFVKIIIVLAAFLMAFVLGYYIRSRIKSYGMFMIMGIRKKTFIFYVALEFVFSLTISYLIGLATGAGIVYLFRYIVRRISGIRLEQVSSLGSVMALALLLYFVTFMLAALVNYIQIADFGLSGSVTGAAASERMPSRGIYALPLLGIFLMGYALYIYHMRQWAEGKMFIFLFLAGLYLLLRYGTYLLLRRKKRRPSYYKRLLADNNFYHRFKSSTNYMYVLTAIHFLILSVFTIQLISCLIAEPVEELYPYDYVCFASDDDVDDLEQTGKDYQAKVQKYPMVRVTAVDGSEKMDNYMQVMIPQGQNIGISESVYRQLKKEVSQKPNEELGLHGDDVYIVYQQDKSVRAHPVDWFMMRMKPYLHTGLPVFEYNPLTRDRERIFPPRDVAGEEFGSVIGVFNRGMQENLIVFSDEYFEKAREEADGPSWLVTMTVPDKNKAPVEEQLEKFRENHVEEEEFDRSIKSWYSADDKADDLLSERLLNESVTIFNLFILLVVGLCIYYIKIASEREMMKQKYEFLECIGMKRKERHKALSREMGNFVAIPLSVSALCAAAITGLTFYLRMYTREDMVRYLTVAAAVWSGYMLVQAVMYLIMKRITLHYIERD